MNRRPLGFVLLAPCAWTFAGFVAWVLSLPIYVLDRPRLLVARAALAGLGVLALLAGDALWRARPWAFRASAALAGAYFLALSAFGLSPEFEGVMLPAMLILLSGIFIGPALAYVYTSTHPPFSSAVLGHPRRRRAP